MKHAARSGRSLSRKGGSSGPAAASAGGREEEDAAQALSRAAIRVSRETLARLSIHVRLVREWQTVKNLIAPSTLNRVWTRHVADSLQLTEAAPQARIWLDLGSGAGFPGLPIAIRLMETGGGMVHLVESDQRKCAFLRAVIRETGAPAVVHAARIEEALSRLDATPDAVTARALAPLPRLLEYCKFLLMAGAVGVFPKGRDVDHELTATHVLRSFRLDLLPSRTDPDGRIVVVRAIETKA